MNLPRTLILSAAILLVGNCGPKQNADTKSNTNAIAMQHCESLNDLSATDAIAKLGASDRMELAVSIDFWDRAAEVNWDECMTTFSAYFDKKVEEYSILFGKPVFNGGMDDAGFPEHYIEQFSVHADQLAIWNYEGQQYAVSIVQEDRELPFIVSFQRIRSE